ncbi:hypothetical protein Barb6XT_01651 [Bacteroidales bacterium Barb6XT]|nr:hypothetical protein Barb4_02678 [Bacteroidales bacterium Barb4]OAV67070.1 hypothetical protein Barb6XT_01651 [Bacteroidales bacterium Barb6XT]
MRAISDINGFDIKFHENEPIKVVRAVRNWFVEAVGLIKESPTAIWDSFCEFNADLLTKKEKENFSQDDIDFMPIPELLMCMRAWLIKKEEA